MGFHRSRAAIFLIGFTAVTVCASAAVAAREGRAVEEMRATALRLEALVDAVDLTRAPLYGEGTPGLAHDEYDRAVKLLSPGFYDDWIEIQKVRKSGPASELADSAEALRGALVARNQASLAALKSGTHRLDAKRVVDWEVGLFGNTPLLMDYRNLANLAVLAAEEHIAADRADMAVDVLLDGMQFGADVTQSPAAISEMIGIALLGITTKVALVDRGLYLSLPPAELERLAVGLSTIDSRLGIRGLAFEAEMANFARLVGKTEDRNILFTPSFELSNARHGFSSTIRVAATVEQELELQMELVGVENLPWAEAKARIEAVAAREDELGQNLWGKVRESIEQSHRYALANVRLTRAAIQAQLEGRVDPMADPFGDELLVSATEDGLQIQSVGPQGPAYPKRPEGLVVFVALD